MSPLELPGTDGIDGEVEQGTGAPTVTDAPGAGYHEPAALLAMSPLFRILPVSLREDLAGGCYRRRYRAGELVVRERLPGDRLFLVASGRARATVGSGRTATILVRRLGPGDVFGEPEGMTGTHRTVSVHAESALETVVFDQTRVLETALQSPAFARALRQHWASGRVEVFLRRASPFAPLPPDLLRRLAERMEPVRYARGERVFEQGDVGDAFYVIEHGAVSILVNGRAVAALRSGDCFGEAALLTFDTRTASVEAAEPAEVLRLDRDGFQELVAEQQELRNFFVELLRRRGLLRSGTPLAQTQVSAAERLMAPREEVRRAAGTMAAALAVALLLALLAVSPTGAYLTPFAILSALLVTGVVLGGLPVVFRLQREAWTGRQFQLALAGAAAGVAFDAWALDLAGLLGPLGGLAGACALSGVVIVAGRRRAYALEIDSLVTGAAAGFGFGVAAALGRWVVGTGSGGILLSGSSWLTLLVLPAIDSLAGALLGTGVWSGREQRRLPVAFVSALGLGALLMVAARVPHGLDLPLLPSAALALVCLGAGVALVWPRFRRALVGRASALLTLGLAGVASADADPSDTVLCRGCGERAPRGQVYCSRCGLSLVTEEDEPAGDQPAVRAEAG